MKLFIVLSILMAAPFFASANEKSVAKYSCGFYSNMGPDPSSDHELFVVDTDSSSVVTVADKARVSFDGALVSMDQKLKEGDGGVWVVASTQIQLEGYPKSFTVAMNWPNHYFLQCERTLLQVSTLD